MGKKGKAPTGKDKKLPKKQPKAGGAAGKKAAAAEKQKQKQAAEAEKEAAAAAEKQRLALALAPVPVRGVASDAPLPLLSSLLLPPETSQYAGDTGDLQAALEQAQATREGAGSSWAARELERYLLHSAGASGVGLGGRRVLELKSAQGWLAQRLSARTARWWWPLRRERPRSRCGRSSKTAARTAPPRRSVLR